MTYAEAAHRLGISTNAIKQRVKRGKLQAATGNDGHARVWLPVQNADTDTKIQTPQTPTPTTPAKPESSGLVSLDDVRRLLGEQSNRLQAAHAAAMEAALDRADRQHAAELARLAQAHQAGVTALMNRVAVMLVERRERAPWWSVLFGAPKIRGE